MSTREFHYTDDTSSKFWRITLAKDSYTVWFGRIGTAGQEQTKTFPDEQSAKTASEKQIAEKLKKGYQEVALEQNDRQAADHSISGMLKNLAATVIAKVKPVTPASSTPSTSTNLTPSPSATTTTTTAARTKPAAKAKAKPAPEPVIPTVYD